MISTVGFAWFWVRRDGSGADGAELGQMAAAREIGRPALKQMPMLN
jgi:hypothetical protein